MDLVLLSFFLFIPLFSFLLSFRGQKLFWVCVCVSLCVCVCTAWWALYQLHSVSFSVCASSSFETVATPFPRILFYLNSSSSRRGCSNLEFQFRDDFCFFLVWFWRNVVKTCGSLAEATPSTAAIAQDRVVPAWLCSNLLFIRGGVWGSKNNLYLFL